MSGDRKAILASVMRLLEALEGGCTVTVCPTSGGNATFQIPPVKTRPLRPIESDILEVLEAEGQRLTTEQLLEALQRHGKDHGDSTVKTTLAALVREGLLSNDPRARPNPGYAPPGQ